MIIPLALVLFVRHLSLSNATNVEYAHNSSYVEHAISEQTHGLHQRRSLTSYGLVPSMSIILHTFSWLCRRGLLARPLHLL
jgi:hypothetical protein